MSRDDQHYSDTGERLCLGWPLGTKCDIEAREWCPECGAKREAHNAKDLQDNKEKYELIQVIVRDIMGWKAQSRTLEDVYWAVNLNYAYDYTTSLEGCAEMLHKLDELGFIDEYVVALAGVLGMEEVRNLSEYKSEGKSYQIWDVPKGSIPKLLLATPLEMCKAAAATIRLQGKLDPEVKAAVAAAKKNKTGMSEEKPQKKAHKCTCKSMDDICCKDPDCVNRFFILSPEKGKAVLWLRSA